MQVAVLPWEKLSKERPQGPAGSVFTMRSFRWRCRHSNVSAEPKPHRGKIQSSIGARRRRCPAAIAHRRAAAPARNSAGSPGGGDVLTGSCCRVVGPRLTGSCGCSFFISTSTSVFLPAVDREVALVDLVLVARDGGIFAFGEHHRRKSADAFADAIARSRQDRPGRIGDRLAAGFGNQLEGDLCCTVLDRSLPSALPASTWMSARMTALTSPYSETM